MVTNERTNPDVSALARWMRTWISDQGAIHGFHNHSVWGTNPFTFLDFTSGHAAFSAPALIAYARALARRPDDRGLELWRRAMGYQSQAVQPDGQYKHIGFQVGESATTGLIHNVVGSLGLLGALQHAGHLLPEAMVGDILTTVRRNLDACERYGEAARVRRAPATRSTRESGSSCSIHSCPATRPTWTRSSTTSTR
ncbi:hypothetical protein GCM10027614_81680 [Micromonospora vulcania]